MKRYDYDDIITVYFVVNDRDGSPIIKAWSDEKEYCKVYMDFHRCKKYKLKSISDTADRIYSIIEENNFDEIGLYNITVHDPDGGSKLISVPLTGTEYNFIQTETNEWMMSRIDYSLINAAKDYFKDRYQDALKRIHLNDVLDSVLNLNNNAFVETVELDELMVLVRSFSNEFGL